MIDFDRLHNALETYLAKTGLFGKINRYEPKSAPGRGLTVGFWPQSIAPVRTSGLQTTSVLAVYVIRIYMPLISEPYDTIDIEALRAADVLMDSMSGDFELRVADGESLIRAIDLLGSHGPPLGLMAGYVEVDAKYYRTLDITVPMIINDVWQQGR